MRRLSRLISAILCFYVISLNPIYVEAESYYLQDDFNSYSSYVASPWRGQVNASLGYTENVPVEASSKGKSARIETSTASPKELLREINPISSSDRYIEFKFSAMLNDTKSLRSLYIRDALHGEMSLFSFNQDKNTISVATKEIASNVFSVKINTWYDIKVSLDMKTGLVKAELKCGDVSSVIYGYTFDNINSIDRIDFAQFTPISGKSVSLLDDVAICKVTPFFASIESEYFIDNFESDSLLKYEVLGSGYAPSVKKTERGGMLLINSSENITGIKKATPYLVGADNISFGFNAQTSYVYSKLNIWFGDNDFLKFDFVNDKIICLGISQSIKYTDELFSVKGFIDKNSKTVEIIINDNKTLKFENVNLDFETRSVSLTSQTDDSDTLYIDDIYFLCGEKINKTKLNDYNISIKTNDFECLVNEKFSYYSGGVPNGFIKQVTPTNDSSYSFTESNGGILVENKTSVLELMHEFSRDISNAEILNYSMTITPYDNYAMRGMYVKDRSANDVSVFNFNENSNTVSIAGVPVPASEFTYSADKTYNIFLNYNLINGEIRVNINDNDNNSYGFSGVGRKDLRSIYRINYVTFPSKETSETLIDNISFEASGNVKAVPTPNENEYINENISYPNGFIDLEFKNNIALVEPLVDCTKNNVDSVSINGKKVRVNLKDLKKNTKYVLTYSAFDESNNQYCARVCFKTKCELEVLSHGFKSENYDDDILRIGKTYSYAEIRGDKESHAVSFVTAVYDKNKSKLLEIEKTTKDVSDFPVYYENCIELENSTFGLVAKNFILEGDSIMPLTESKQTSVYERPSGTELVNRIFSDARNVHPRILATGEDFNNIKKSLMSDNAKMKLFQEEKRLADELLETECKEYDIYDGIRLSSSAIVRSRVKTLGIVYNITGDEKYAQRAFEELQNAASYPDWNPNHYLDAATMMNAFALGYDLCYDYISKDESKKKLIVDTVKNYGFESVLDDYLDRPRNRTYKWTLTNEPDNWNIICNSCAMVAALTFSEELPEYCARIFDNATVHIERALNRFGPDGAWFEGVGYWHYQMMFYADLLSGLNNTIGDDLGFSKVKGFKETPYYPFAMMGPAGTFNFHDCEESYINSEEMYLLSSLLNDDKIASLQTNLINQNHLERSNLSLLWDKSDKNSQSTNLPLDFNFTNTEVCTFRSGWDKDDTFVGFHAGRNNIPHGHLDVGEFVVDMLGERFACELGGEDYNLPVTHDWEPYRNRAEGHNTLVINPSINPDQNASADTVISAFKSSEGEAMALCDMTDAYKGKVIKAIRGVKLTDNRNVVVIRDEIASDNNIDFWWFMHTTADISINSSGKSAILNKNGKMVLIQLISSDDLVFTVSNPSPLPESPQNSMQNPNIGYRKLTIHSNQYSALNYSVVISPLGYVHTKDYSINLNNW